MKIKLAVLLTIITVSSAYADTFNFITPAGSKDTADDPVSASATVVTGAGTVTITLNDLLANPKDAGQLLSDFDFVLSNGATTGTLHSQTGNLILIDGSGKATSDTTDSENGWQLNNSVGGGLQLDALGGGQPKDTIIGPAGSGGIYSNANNSIAGSGPHNPFISGTATFVVDVTGVTADTRITSATFSFGTDAGDNVPSTLSSVPEPTSMLLLGSTLGVLLVGVRKRLSSR